MNKLIVTAHPNPEGFTHKIAKRFIETSENKWHDCFLMDLYSEERKQDYLQLDHMNKAIPDNKRELIQHKIMWADEIVFIFPLWNFDAPAIMKNWVDVNFSSGFAYRYKPGSLLPHRFLQWKTARIILTAWSPKFIILTAGLGILVNRALARLFYFGIRLRSYTVFGKLPAKKTKEEREKMLAKVGKIAMRN